MCKKYSEGLVPLHHCHSLILQLQTAVNGLSCFVSERVILLESLILLAHLDVI